jgi:hypothetical protein
VKFDQQQQQQQQLTEMLCMRNLGFVFWTAVMFATQAVLTAACLFGLNPQHKRKL